GLGFHSTLPPRPGATDSPEAVRATRGNGGAHTTPSLQYTGRLGKSVCRPYSATKGLQSAPPQPTMRGAACSRGSRMNHGTPSSAPVDRRTFVQGVVGAAALTAASYERVSGANGRVGVGFIGFGLIGKRHVLDFKEQPDAALVAVAEVHRGRLAEAQ